MPTALHPSLLGSHRLRLDPITALDWLTPEIGTGLHPLAASLNAWLETSEADVALWGVHVRSLDSGEEIYNHEGGHLLLPASTMKLVNLESV